MSQITFQNLENPKRLSVFFFFTWPSFAMHRVSSSSSDIHSKFYFFMFYLLYHFFPFFLYLTLPSAVLICTLLGLTWSLHDSQSSPASSVLSAPSISTSRSFHSSAHCHSPLHSHTVSSYVLKIVPSSIRQSPWSSVVQMCGRDFSPCFCSPSTPLLQCPVTWASDLSLQTFRPSHWQCH